jgi:hypothetical protein
MATMVAAAAAVGMAEEVDPTTAAAAADPLTSTTPQYPKDLQQPVSNPDTDKSRSLGEPQKLVA